MTQKLSWAAAAILVVSAIAVAEARTSASSAIAKDVVRLMEQRGMDSIAAADPQEPGRFVAALHIEGGQLLVVSGLHPAVEALRQRLAAGAHRDVYLDLQGTPSPKGKFFVMDAGSDGLYDGPDGSDVDVVFRDGESTVRFDGNAKAQSLTDAAYARDFADADMQYVHDLDVLKSVLTAPASTASAPLPGSGV
jgi:hypothetical protein